MGFLLNKWKWILQKTDDLVVNVADILDYIYNQKKTIYHTFHDGVLNANVPNGNVYHNVDGKKAVTVSIGGTSTAQVYEFRTIDSCGTDQLVTMYKVYDSSSGTGTSVKGDQWQVAIEGVPYFYVKLISISGGTGIVMAEIT